MKICKQSCVGSPHMLECNSNTTMEFLCPCQSHDGCALLRLLNAQLADRKRSRCTSKPAPPEQASEFLVDYLLITNPKPAVVTHNNGRFSVACCVSGGTKRYMRKPVNRLGDFKLGYRMTLASKCHLIIIEFPPSARLRHPPAAAQRGGALWRAGRAGKRHL